MDPSQGLYITGLDTRDLRTHTHAQQLVPSPSTLELLLSIG